jgi:hypothetical protein
MEFGHRATVFGDHQHLTGGRHLIHQAEAAGFELRGTDGLDHGSHRELSDSSAGLTMIMTMVTAEGLAAAADGAYHARLEGA